MILLYEPLQLHASHAPFTRAFTQMIAHAFPDQRLIIHARASHLQAAFAEPSCLLDGRLTQQGILESHGHSPFLSTLRLLHATYSRWQRHEPIVVFLTSRPYHIWAAKLLKRRFADFRCHLVLHGDINTVRQARPRNPFLRLADHFSSIAHANHPDVRLLTLETHIGVNLAETIPAARPYIDVIHHPCLPGPSEWRSPITGHMRFGLLGIASRAKGLDVFARLASQVAVHAAEAVEFRLIGKMQPGWQEFDLRGISGPLPFVEDWLPRPVFEQELARLNYVVLPYNMEYYALAASGVLLDALRWRKPMIAFETPVLREITQRFGEVGHICKDENEMLATLRSLVHGFDRERYQMQQRNLDVAYHSRLPEIVAAEYAMLVESRWKHVSVHSRMMPGITSTQ